MLMSTTILRGLVAAMVAGSVSGCALFDDDDDVSSILTFGNAIRANVDTDPDTIANDETDTLASQQALGSEAIYYPVGVALGRDFSDDGGTAITQDGYIKSIHANAAGGFDATIVIDGESVLYSFAAADYADGDFILDKDGDASTTGDQVYLFSYTGAFDEDGDGDTATSALQDGNDSYTYMDLAGWYVENARGDDIDARGYFAYGARTPEANLPEDTATYEGGIRADSYDVDNASNRERVRGDLTLIADFAQSTITGSIDEIYVDNSEIAGSIDINDGSISGSSFTADLLGTGEDVGDFRGEMAGDFFGPNAEEVGGVLSGQGFNSNGIAETNVTGVFGASQEDEMVVAEN